MKRATSRSSTYASVSQPPQLRATRAAYHVELSMIAANRRPVAVPRLAKRAAAVAANAAWARDTVKRACRGQPGDQKRRFLCWVLAAYGAHCAAELLQRNVRGAMRLNHCTIATTQTHELVECDAEAADGVVVDAALAPVSAKQRWHRGRGGVPEAASR